MGNNAAFADFQAIVIMVYDWGQLTLERLDQLGNNWQGQDVDTGGYRDRCRAKDGKGIFQIVAQTVDPDAGPEYDPLDGDDPGDDPDGGYYAAYLRIASERWGWC